MRVAYFSPMPPGRSGIADYSTLLLPALRERVEEVVVARPGRRAPRADVCLYHVGNDPDSHAWIVDELRRRPGVVVLHELVLHHLIAGMTIGRGNGRAYLNAMERDFGVAGRLIGLGVLDNLLPLIWETQPDRFPLTGSVLDLAGGGLIVHSRFVEAGARAAGYDGPIWRIPHPAWPPAAIEPAGVVGDPLIGCFGHQNMNKRIPQLLEAFTLLRARRPGARLLLVGVPAERFDLDRRLERLGIGGEALIREGYVSEERLMSLMAACDVLVNLRSPTMGETSGSVIRGLSLGKAMLVSDVGWFCRAPRRGGPEDPGRRVRGGDDRRRARACGGARARARRGRASLRRRRARPRPRRGCLRHRARAGGRRRDGRRRGARGDCPRRGGGGHRGHPGARPARARGGNRVSASGPLRARALSVPAAVWVAGIVVVSVCVRVALARRIVAPWIMVDEIVYSELAKSFAAHADFLVRGVPSRGYGVVYPVLIAPAWRLFGAIPSVYTAAKVINCVLMSLAAVPAYLLARRVLVERLALVAAALSLLVPSMLYTGMLMTENVYYPVFLAFALLLLVTLEHPTAARQVGLVALFAVAYETRAQSAALVPALATAPVLYALMRREGLRRGLAPFRLLYGILAAGALVALAAAALRGRSPLGLLGAYDAATTSTYTVSGVAHFLLYHLAELDLYLGVVPFAALVAVWFGARRPGAPLAAFAAATASISIWLIAEVAAFASQSSVDRIEERNMFYLAPFALVALLALRDDGLVPRRGRAALAAAALAGVLPFFIPFTRFITTSAVSDTFALLPWWWVQDHWISIAQVRYAAGAVALVGAVVFLLSPRRLTLAPRGARGRLLRGDCRRRRQRTPRHPRRLGRLALGWQPPPRSGLDRPRRRRRRRRAGALDGHDRALPDLGGRVLQPQHPRRRRPRRAGTRPAPPDPGDAQLERGGRARRR